MKSGALICAALSLQLAHADTTNDTPILLDAYVVSAGPVPKPISEFAQPVDLISSTELQRSGAESLGDALSWQPGVSASAFSTGASRPVLRGFDGPRVRVLDSGLEALDASATSPDHGVAVEPLLIDRIEIIRGPSTLLYGSSAIGGAVNTIGREIPTAPIPNGSTGAVEARYDGASDGKTYLGYTQFGTEQWALSFTGLTRRSNDYDIPGNANVGGGGSDDSLENSFVETDRFSVGGSWFPQADSHVGIAYSEYDSLYGVPGEDVAIDLFQRRIESELEVTDPSPMIEAFRLRAAYTDYTHSELEGGAVGTVFERDGWEIRAEAAHAPIGIISQGLIGGQISENNLSALGDEAFTPPAKTKNQAVFLSEHLEFGSLHSEFGGRVEHQSVKAEGAPSDYDALALSLAMSWIWDLNEQNSLSITLQRAQRHPTSTELYARGPHLATAQYEIGDPGLELETAYGVDLTYRSTHERWDTTLSVFYTYFEDYIFQNNLGFQTDVTGLSQFDPGFDPAEALDTYQFDSVDAVFWGFEAEAGYQVYQSEATTIRLSTMADYVRAENRQSGDPLPRIPPLRIGSELSIQYATWTFTNQLRYAFSHTNTAPGETDTDGYTEWNLDLSKRIPLSDGSEWTVFAQAKNLLNEEIRYSTSFLKDSAPQPGRGIQVGARFEF